jgi:hypothetical protein
VADIPELSKTFKMTYYLGAAIIVGCIIATWVVGLVYFEFEHLKRDKLRMEIYFEAEITRVESRLDKITKRDRLANEKKNKETSNRVTVLELPNSDK